MNEAAIEVGKRLRAARKRVGLLADQIADRLACGRSAVFAWESGEYEPDPRQIRGYLEVCNADETEILAVLDLRSRPAPGGAT